MWDTKQKATNKQTKKLTDTENSMAVIRGERGWGEIEKGKGGQDQRHGDGRRLALGDEHTVHHTDDVVQDCTPETYIILLTTVTLIN